MIASGRWRPQFAACAEFAHPGDDRVVEHAAPFEILEQRRQCLVGGRNQIVFEPVEVVAVRVPEVAAIVVPIDRHERDAMLDQAARKQDALAVDVAAVSISDRIGLDRQVEGLPCRRRA